MTSWQWYLEGKRVNTTELLVTELEHTNQPVTIQLFGWFSDKTKSLKLTKYTRAEVRQTLQFWATLILSDHNLRCETCTLYPFMWEVSKGRKACFCLWQIGGDGLKRGHVAGIDMLSTNKAIKVAFHHEINNVEMESNKILLFHHEINNVDSTMWK